MPERPNRPNPPVRPPTEREEQERAEFRRILRHAPPLPDKPPPFPLTPPLDAGIAELSGLWLVAKCGCEVERTYPLRLMAANIGWKITLGEVLPRLRCEKCGQRPSEVHLTNDPASGFEGRMKPSPIARRLRVM